MLKPKRFIVVASLFLLGVGAFGFAQSRTSQREGAKPYTPTRLEWLALEMNAEYRRDAAQDRPYFMDFFPIGDEDAILIHISYLPSASRRDFEQAVNDARRGIAAKATARGWTSWLEVQERVEMLRFPQ